MATIYGSTPPFTLNKKPPTAEQLQEAATNVYAAKELYNEASRHARTIGLTVDQRIQYGYLVVEVLKLYEQEKP